MASTEEIRSGLADIVNEVAGIPADDVQLDKSFTDDLDVDSLSMVEVVVAAEEKFGVKIPDEEVKNLTTVGDAVAFIEPPKAETPETPWWAGPDRAGPSPVAARPTATRTTDLRGSRWLQARRRHRTRYDLPVGGDVATTWAALLAGHPASS